MKDISLVCDKALAALRERGADMANVAAVYSETREFNVDGGEFSLFRTLFDDSLAMNAFQGGRKGTGFVNRFDSESIAAAAESCMASCASGEPDACWELAAGEGVNTIRQGVPEPDMDRFFSRLREFMDDVRARHPSIIMEQLVASHTVSHSLRRTSLGAAWDVLGGQYSVDMSYSAHEGDAGSSFFGSAVTFESLERPIIELGSIERDLADTEKQIYPVPFEGKFEGAAVFTPGSLCEIMFSALSNFAGETGILSGTGIWKESLGTQVAHESLTVALNPHDPRVVCASPCTAEGYPAEDYTLIDRGVLRSFMLSQYTANRTGNKRAPNLSGSMIISPGERSLEEIIASVDRGILVGRLSGGAPGPSGEASSVAKNSFLIENGRITDAVSEVMISMNLSHMLKNVLGVSRETVADGSTVLPWAAFGGVTISGK